MNQFSTILEYLDRLKTLILEHLGRIENHPFYDRMLNRFESLEARHQKWIVSGARLALLALVAWAALSPLLGLWNAKSRLGDQRRLLTEMKLFNEAVETRPRPATPPSDWQPLAASTPEEASNSLKSYLASLGFPDGSYQFLTSSNSHLQLDIPELNLRQAQAILYQIDGWYPQISSQILSLKVLPSDEQKLTMSLTLAHKGGFENPGDGAGGAIDPSANAPRRNRPRNVNAPDDSGLVDDTGGGVKVPPEAYSNGGFDDAIPSERPRNPNLDDYPPNGAGSEEGLPDFESLENNEALDSLPPPPPIEEDFGDSE